LAQRPLPDYKYHSQETEIYLRPRWTPNPQTRALDRAATGMGNNLADIIIKVTRSYRNLCFMAIYNLYFLYSEF